VTPSDKPSSASIPDLRDLERLIEFEIKQRDDQERSKGWTPWLLAVAICALLWRLVESAGSQNWSAVGLFWATTILLVDMGKSLSVWFAIEGSEEEPSPRYFAANWLLRGSRGHFVLVGIKLVAATLLIFFLAALPEPLRWLWLAYVVVAAAEAPVLLLLSYSEIGIKPLNPGIHRGFRIGLWIRWATVSAAAVLLAILWWNCLNMFLTRESLKIALLMVGIAELATLWSELHSGSAVRDSLLQLRRAIGLGELAGEDARRRIDEVLHGAETPQFLSKDVKAFDRALAALTPAQSAAQDALAALKTLIASPAQLPKEGSAVLADAKAKVADAQTHLDKVTKVRQQAAMHAAVVMSQAPKVTADVKGLLQRLETNADAATKLQRELALALSQVESALRPPEPPGPGGPRII
jgi:hypothetical protein